MSPASSDAPPRPDRTPAPARRRLSPEARRAQLLEHAVDAFAELGLERAGHGDIARRAGVSTPTVFNYFPTRDALVGAVLARIEANVEEMFARIPDRADSRRTRILQLAATFRQMVAERPNETKAFLKWGVSFDPDMRPAYLAFQTRILDRLVAVLPDNPADPAKARAEARILYGASNLFAAMTFDDFPPGAMTDFIGRIADVLGAP
ncbi:MAG: TetR/AcrR family transcriptional regulator [Pseudomonadota bacterium]